MSKKNFHWNKKYKNNLTTNLLTDVEKILLPLYEKRFNAQKGAGNKKFPIKKNKKKSNKYLYSTGKMVKSIIVRVKDKGQAFSVSLRNKAQIYRKYLHDQTEWLALDSKDIKLIIKLKQKNFKKKGK